jgi:hypothetical protein
MPLEHRAAEHHISAANHHEAAARYHREASRFYLAGEDHAHAAHQALIAIGHAWLAIDYGKRANKYYVDQDVDALQKYVAPVPHLLAQPLETGGTLQTNLSCAEHHAKAAENHELAANHHSQAVPYCAEKNYVLAAREAHLAHGYAQHSVYHGIEATKLHVERQVRNPADCRNLETGDRSERACSDGN